MPRSPVPRKSHRVAAAAQADNRQDLIVLYDQSNLLMVSEPVAEIIIGNPTIADITIQGGNLIVVTGKSFGITNMIALSATRKIVMDMRIIVQRDERKVVNLVKGTKRESYNCSPQCNPSIVVGDDTAYFASVSKDAERKIKLSEGQADAGGGSANSQ